MMNIVLSQPLLAMAAPPGGASQGSPLQMPIMMFLMMAVIWVLFIRPQQRREKERRLLLSNIKSGDRVAFSGGIIGVVTNVKDKTLTIKIADNVKIEVSRGAVNQVLEKGEHPEAGT